MTEPVTAHSVNRDVWLGFLRHCKFAIGDHVRRVAMRRGVGVFEGNVCGFYSTTHVHVGVVVQSLNDPMETRMIPEASLEMVKSGLDLPR